MEKVHGAEGEGGADEAVRNENRDDPVSAREFLALKADNAALKEEMKELMTKVSKQGTNGIDLNNERQKDVNIKVEEKLRLFSQTIQAAESSKKFKVNVQDCDVYGNKLKRSRSGSDFSEIYMVRTEKLKKKHLAQSKMWYEYDEYKRRKIAGKEDKDVVAANVQSNVGKDDILDLNIEEHDRFEEDDVLYAKRSGQVFKNYVTEVKVNNVYFLHGTRRMALMDSGCEKSCCGEEWNNDYISSLSREDRELVKIQSYKAKFKFGSGKVFTSHKLVIAPIYIAGSRKMMAYSVLDVDLPLLMSLYVMKRLEMCVSYSHKGKDTATINGVSMHINFHDGHIWLPISKTESTAAIIHDESSKASPPGDDILGIPEVPFC